MLSGGVGLRHGLWGSPSPRDLLRVSLRRAGFVGSLMNPFDSSFGCQFWGGHCRSQVLILPCPASVLHFCIVCLLCCSISSLPLGGAGAWEAGM